MESKCAKQYQSNYSMISSGWESLYKNLRMVVGAFPLAKLGILSVKHISKPIGNIIKNAAKKSSFVKRFIATPPAQLYNNIEVRAKIWMLGMKQPRRIPPLNETMAVQMGADIVSELIIFIIGVSLILLEFSRQARNDRRKHEKYKAQKEEMHHRLLFLTDQVNWQAKEIKGLKSRLNQSLGGNEQECV